MALLAARLVGRAEELGALDRLLDDLDRGGSAAVAVVGEPGIGKTRLLAELAARGETRRHLVLGGSASELERDLPFWVFVDALEEYVQGLDPRRLQTLGDGVLAELALVLPALAHVAPAREPAVQHERYRSHRAVRIARPTRRSPACCFSAPRPSSRTSATCSASSASARASSWARSVERADRDDAA